MMRTAFILLLFVPTLALAENNEHWACDQSPLVIEDVVLFPNEKSSVIAIADGFISFVGVSEDLPDAFKNARRVKGGGASALPGLIDSHTHFDALAAAKHVQNDMDVQSERFPITMRQTLASGVTTTRTHLAGLDDMAVMRESSKHDCFPAPRFSLAGPGLLGGAPDVNGRLMRGVTGPEDAREKIIDMANRGAEWAALHGLGRFDNEILAEIFLAAAESGIKLMADTDSIEYFSAAIGTPILSGEYINRSDAPLYPEELISALKARDAPFYVVPPIGFYKRSVEHANAEDTTLDSEVFLFVDETLELAQRETFQEHFERDEYIAKAVDNFETMPGKFQQLQSAGAILLVGSDSGSLGQFHHDAIWREMAAWASFGVPSDEILNAATRLPAQMLDKNDVGAIAPGMRGDIVLYSGDLRNGEFAREGVVAVIKSGIVFVNKGAWVGPSRNEMNAALLELAAQNTSEKK